jgi:protein arginine kinase
LFTGDDWKRPAGWLDGSGQFADVIINTRVRLARNLAGLSFPHTCDEDTLRRRRRQFAERVRACPALQGAWDIDLELLEPLERQVLLEMHLASPDLLREPAGRGLVVTPDLSCAIMVNEEDHLRVQKFTSGFDPLATTRAALDLDRELDESLEFAFSEEFGYLTTCPTNVGTGCRLSVLIHLPALVLGNEIEKILNSLRQLQFAVRGLFGEGSTVRGSLFQISNLATLGRSEIDIAADFSRHVAKVAQYEKMAQEKFYERDPAAVEDLAQRSLAILRSARVMTMQEAFDRLSQVRMGVMLRVLPPIAMSRLNQALIQHQAAHLQLLAGRSAKPIERARMRADFLRNLLRDN